MPVNNYSTCKWIKHSNQNKTKDIDWQNGFLKKDPTIYWVEGTNSIFKDTNTLKVKGRLKKICANSNQKGVAILINSNQGWLYLYQTK